MSFLDIFKSIEVIFILFIMAFIILLNPILRVPLFENIVIPDYGVFISLAATLLGFLIAAFALMFALPSDKFLNIFKGNEDIHSKLFYIFIISLLVNLILLLVSLLNFTSIYLSNSIMLSLTIGSIYFIGVIIIIFKSIIDLYFKENPTVKKEDLGFD